jgi:hypothetical protein
VPKKNPRSKKSENPLGAVLKNLAKIKNFHHIFEGTNICFRLFFVRILVPHFQIVRILSGAIFTGGSFSAMGIFNLKFK